MIYGDQWNCPSCTWANLFIRRRCRNCGKDKPADAPIVPAEHVIAAVHARSQPHNGPSNQPRS